MNDARHYYLTVENDKGSDSFYVTLTVKGMKRWIRLSTQLLTITRWSFSLLIYSNPIFISLLRHVNQ